MKINRHNYEEFFILYLDNELSSDDCRMVEIFVQNNPDLKEELDVLLQTKLTADKNIVFDNKNELLNISEKESINQNNYEEWLMLYMDNELSSEQKMNAESFIASHPGIKAEFEVFNKTKILADKEIIFPNKELLYKRTEKVRIVQMRWWTKFSYRIAAAVVLILAIGIATAIIFKNKNSAINNGLSFNRTKEQKTDTSNSVIRDKEKNIPMNQQNIAQQVKQSHKIIPDKQNIVVAVNKKIGNSEKSNHLPQPTNDPYRSIDIPDRGIAAMDNPKSNDLISTDLIKNNNPVTINIPPALNNQKQNKSVTDKTNHDIDAMYASESDNKKSNLRGFFRKITRTIEKRTGIDPANDDGKVMIAGLAVKLK